MPGWVDIVYDYQLKFFRFFVLLLGFNRNKISNSQENYDITGNMPKKNKSKKS